MPSRTEPGLRLESLTDTALWMAHHRALESRRPDAIFRDPYARRLAGPRGAALGTAAALSGSEWASIVRTAVFDELITESLAHRSPAAVLNLAAGLDTRPYRLAVPEDTLWVEVDLPEVISYKSRVLRNARPVCSLERIGMDLSDGPARRALLARLDRLGRALVVVSEGFLVYLTPSQVRSLGKDLHARSNCEVWITDLITPAIRANVNRSWVKESIPTGLRLRFAPANGPEFFLPLGWKPAEFRSLWTEAARLLREMPFAWTVKADPSSTDKWSAGVVSLRRE